MNCRSPKLDKVQTTRYSTQFMWCGSSVHGDVTLEIWGCYCVKSDSVTCALLSFFWPFSEVMCKSTGAHGLPFLSLSIIIITCLTSSFRTPLYTHLPYPCDLPPICTLPQITILSFPSCVINHLMGSLHSFLWIPSLVLEKRWIDHHPTPLSHPLLHWNEVWR